MIRYNVLLRDGHLPILSFADPVKVTGGAPWSRRAILSSPYINRDPEDVYATEAQRVALAPLFEVATNVEVPEAALPAEREDYLLGLARKGVAAIADLFEEYVEATCAEHERVHGAPPAVVTVAVRTGPTVLTAEDPECPGGPTVGFSIFMNVGVLASSAAPSQASGWTPGGKLVTNAAPVECDIGGQL